MKKFIDKNNFLLCLYLTLSAVLLLSHFFLMVIFYYTVDINFVLFVLLATVPSITCYLTSLFYEKVEDMKK